MRTNGRTPILLLASLVLAACGGPTEPEPGSDPGSGSGDELAATEDILVEAGATTALLTESSEQLANPERGFYVGYHLLDGRDAGFVRASGHTLAISVVYLEGYRDRPLSTTLLDKLRVGFDRARAAGIKLVVRFAYNDDYTADASLPQVLQHIGQLAPVLRDNQDVIAVVQAGFIGAYGEWHSSSHDLDQDPAARAAIIGALLDAVPTSRSVQIRKPDYKDAIVAGAVTADEAYGGSMRARIGHHNDCFLASSTDFGTYEDPIAQWKAYVAADSAYVPMGGETCGLHARNTCAAAIAEMTQLHWTYLNDQYHQGVLARWITDGCDGEIRKRLGYRFVGEQVTFNERVAPGGVLAVQLDVANRGFAAPINARPVELALIGADGTRQVARLDVDARRLPAGETTTIAARLRVPADLAPGTYTLALRMPDADPRLAGDPRYAIQLANTGSWDAATGDNVLTRALVVDAAAPGARDPGATELAQL